MRNIGKGLRALLFISFFTVLSAVTVKAQAITITRIDTEITGNTRRTMLLTELRIREGKEFDSVEDLEKVLINRAQVLRRRRIFALFEWKLETPRPDEAYVFIRIVDILTLYPRPVLNYSSDRGLTIGGRLQYNNAFGTLIDQDLEAYWSPEQTRMRFDADRIPLGPLDLSFSWEQFNGITRFGDPDGNTDVEYVSSHSYLALAADLPVGPTSPWSYRFEPTMIWRYSGTFSFNTGAFPDSRYFNLGYGLGFRHGLHYNRVNWMDNFRTGIRIDLENENTWFIRSGGSRHIFESDIVAYRPITRWWEISGKFGGFYATEGLRENAGDRLRGVVDFMTFGKWGLFLTAQFSFRLFGVEDIGELQLRPFGDFGYVYSEEWNHGAESWEYCVGATTIIFLDALPGLVFNVEWGWDFKRKAPELIIDTRLQI